MSADAIHGVLARTQAGRQRLQTSWQRVIPETFPGADAGWWVDPDAGLALHGTAIAVSEGADPVSALVSAGDARLSLGAQPETRAREGAGDGVHDLLRQLCRCGSDTLRDQRGAFALAFWNGARRSLQLLRDPFGQRALFVRDDGDLVVFCSELAPLLADPAFDCRLDLESAHHFLCFGLPLAGRTLARGVACVPAGHALEWSPGQPLRARRYYSPLGFDHAKTVDAEGRAGIAAALDRAIAARDGDGRAAILLSGGVDSSYIAATCAMRHGGDGYDAYTVDFVGGSEPSEVPFAAQVARAAGIRHHVVPMRVADAVAALDPVLALAQPCTAWAALTHRHLLGRIHGDGHARLLSGLGADEVFGGYSKYLHHYRRLRAQAARWNTAGVDAFDGLLWQPTQARAQLFPGVPRFFDDASQRAGFHAPFDRWSHAPLLIAFYRECRQQKPAAHLFESMVAHECQHRIPDLLMAGFEPMARSAGVDTRYPFLDPELAAIACALGASERFWLSGGRWKNKKVLRRIALERLPEEIIVRPPMSYTTPIRAWFADPAFAAAAGQRLRGSVLWDQGLVRIDWLDRIQAELRAPPRAVAKPGLQLEQLWVLLVLAAWCDRWIGGSARRPRITP